VTGTIDSEWRALLPITLRHPATGSESAVDAWVDTAFTGDLTLPRALVASLGFPKGTQRCERDWRMALRLIWKAIRVCFRGSDKS
jgi:predicted aspartyl protease